MTQLTEAFCAALQAAENDGTLEPLSALFATDATLSNATLHAQGRDGALRFWQAYLDQFDHIRSTFTHVIDSGDQTALAWRSEGRLKGGEPVSYRGVSLLESDSGKVRRFEAIYETAAFIRPAPRSAEPAATAQPKPASRKENSMREQ